MKNFRIVRIAVTLSLIVTMMTQPMVIASIAAGCGDSGCGQRTPMVCEGCGCCEVLEAGDSCCCCGDSEQKAKTQSTDCGHGSPDDPDAIQSALVKIIKGVCRCGLSHPPMDRESERQRVSERVEVRDFIITFIQPDDSNGRRQFAAPPVSLAATGKIPRFSQRLLCVWRI